MTPTVNENLLQDIEQELLSRQEAPHGLRFVNYIIDLISFYAIIITLIILLVIIAPNSRVFRLIENMDEMTDFIVLHVFYGVYMLVVEGIFKGKTLGKLITRTRVVHQNTASFSWRDAFWRGCMRMIPLEYVTGCVGSPFHDQWTETKVVRERK